MLKYTIISFIFMFVITSCLKEKDLPQPPNGLTNKIILKIDSVRNVQYKSANVYGSSGDLLNYSVEQYGNCWDTTEMPTIDKGNITIFNNLTSNSTFTSSLTNLKPAKKYYVRSYAKTSTIVAYSDIISFTTKALEPPTFTNDSTININSTSATVWSSVASEGGGTVSERGICWNSSSNPTIANYKIVCGSGTGSFSSKITGLSIGNKYYVRSYVVCELGTFYSNETNFTTELGIGDNYQGGIIAYVLKSGDNGYITGEFHGFVAAQTDIGIRNWYPGDYTPNFITSTSLGTGKNNTNTIVTNLGNPGPYAAKLCYDLVLNGYDDWYLPSKDELLKLCINKKAIGGFDTIYLPYYWSSSQVDSSSVWVQNFINCNSGISSIGIASNNVRAIRSF